MTIKTEILRELRNGTPLAEVRGKYRSQSQLYEAIREFLWETDKTVKGARETSEKVEQQLRKTKAKLQQLRREKKQASREIEELQKEREVLTREVIGRTERLDRFNADITELRAKGFTPEILKRIATIEKRSGSDLLSHVETVEKHRRIKKEVSGLKKKKAGLKGEVQALGILKKELEAEVVSENNRLDELKLRTATVREVVAAVCSLFSAGYSTEDIKSLAAGLGMIGIKGDPLWSITRLVEGLEKQKTLLTLQDRVTEKKAELDGMKAAAAEEKAELNVARQLTKAFNEVRDAGVKAISDAAGQADKELKGTAAKLNAHVQQTMEGVRTELGQWGQLQQQMGKLEEILGFGLVLLGILKSTEFLGKVPLSMVVQLFDRLHRWCEIHLPDVSVRPSQNIWKKECSLFPVQSYKISALIELVYEGLRDILIKQNEEA